MKTFEELQTNLGSVWSLNRPGSSVEHVVVVLPSFSMGESLLSHYATRIPALEHRYLGLRTSDGIARADLSPAAAAAWQRAGWAIATGDMIRLTPEGWLRLDALVAAD